MPSVSTGGSSGTSYDYIQDTDPTADNDVETGETWLDTSGDGSEPKIYDGSVWNSLSITDHSQLSGVTEDQHFTHAAVAGSGSHSDLSDVGAGDHRSDANILGVLDNSEAVPFPVYASTADVPALNVGEVVMIDGDGLYVEDGT